MDLKKEFLLGHLGHIVFPEDVAHGKIKKKKKSLARGENTPDISHNALCSHYRKIQLLPINFHGRHRENVLIARENYSSSSPQMAGSFGTRRHAQRMLSTDQRPAALVQPPPAGRVRGVSWTEIELLRSHKCASDQHPSAPTRLTFASSVASHWALSPLGIILEQLQRIPV